MKRLWLFLLVLALAGCADLETGYAVTDPQIGSVNGCSALLARLQARTSLHRTWQLTPRLEHDTELLIHVARAPGLPSTEACSWIQDWLDAKQRRTAVLVLRDGNLAPFLCRRWAGEARNEASRGDGPLAAALDTLAERLETRAMLEEENEWPKDQLRCPLFTVAPGGRQRPRAVEGVDAVPLAMTTGLALKAENAVPLRNATLGDGRRMPFMIEVPFDESRLLVVANATPLLDGALADPQARRLAAAVLDRILAWKPAHAAWVMDLRVRESEPQAANPMLRLFTADPFRWAAWHATALVLLALWSAAIWLGRREEPRDVRPQRFGAHVDALAGHLRDNRHHAWCARAIARLRGLPAPPAETRDEQRARAWLAEQLLAERKP